MDSKVKPRADGLFEQWQAEHSALRQTMTVLSEWIALQSQKRATQFQETVQKLNDLNSQLQTHFRKEDELCEQIRESCPSSSLEAEAVRRQSERDHADISNRLKHLIDRLQEARMEQDSWNHGVYELGLIMDVIEQHEEQESESVCCLLPRQILKAK